MKDNFLESVCGCTAVNCLSGEIVESIGNKTYYDTIFGNIVAAGFGITAVGIWRNLRRESCRCS